MSSRIFISYARPDKEWKDKLAAGLENAGLSFWVDHTIDAGDRWLARIREALADCEAAICLVSRSYLESEFCQNEELPAILEKRATGHMLVIPILVEDCRWRELPWLASVQLIPADGKSVAADYAGRDREFFADIAEYCASRLRRTQTPKGGWRPPIDVDVSRLPTSGATTYGREQGIDRLDSAWHSPDIFAYSITGASGVGKSTLIEAWLERLRVENYRDARRVFGWSFQAAGPADIAIDTDLFFSRLFRWFDEDYPSRSSPWERGNRLARLVRQESLLLILDGIDALQSGDGEETASLGDPAIARLLTELARDNRGLVVTTSRRAITELDPYPNSASREHLDVLSPRAGAAVLTEAGIKDGDAEALSEAYGNHALALSLLGGYRWEVPDSDLGRLPASAGVAITGSGPGRHAYRVLDAFEARFRDRPEMQLLRSIALFDQVCEYDALSSLRDASIPGFSDKLSELTDDDWDGIVDRLRGCRLLMPAPDHAPDCVDVHPMVRHYFAIRAQAADKHGWRAAHEHLYQYFSNRAEPLPASVDAFQPLYRSVRHGCEAGRHQHVLDNVFWKRILRCNDQFSWRSLGLIESDLGAISHFFADPWAELASGIKNDDAGFVIGQAAIYLGMSGDLQEAVPLLRRSIDVDCAAGRFFNASITASNLAYTSLLLGDIGRSIEVARHSVANADRASDDVERAISRTTLGNALHRGLRLDDAQEQFEQAEEIQRGVSGHAFLHAGQGREFGDLLIARGRWSDAQARAKANLSRDDAAGVQEQSHIAAARAYLAELRDREDGDLGAAERHAESALDLLRDRGQMDMLPLGLLTRADLYRYQFRNQEALDDLDETLELCRRCGMRLYEADALVRHAQIAASLGQRSIAADSASRAVDLTTRIDYHWYDAELTTLQNRLEGGPSP